MTSTVTIMPMISIGSEVDRLGRPVTTPGAAETTVGRLTRDTSPEYQPIVDGVVVATWRLFLPLGTVVPPDAKINVEGRELAVIDAPDSPTSPMTGAGYVVVTVREVA